MIKSAGFSETIDPTAHENAVLAWRRARLSRLTAKDSWLSLVGKFWLHDGANTVGADELCDVALPSDKAGAAIGVLELRDGRVSFSAAQGTTVLLRRGGTQVDEPVQGSVQLATDQPGPADRLVLGSLLLEIMQRGSEIVVRVRDTESAARLQFPGIDHYPIRHDLRVIATLEPYTPHKRIELLYETGSMEPYESPGAAVFQIEGTTVRVDPVIERNPERLYVIFADQTNRDSTYGSGRFLYAPMPQDNRVLLDFNQAFNPPCAFTPYAFCPLAPPQNRLPVRIEAGEKRPLYGT